MNIVYDDRGTGLYTLVFLHGWCLNRSYWADQVSYFSSSYRVITLDLPGFGESGRNRKNWSVEEYAKDITALITQLNLHNIILIGHSTSGQVALETALQNRSRVVAVIGVNNFKDIGQIETAESKQDEVNFYDAARLNFKPLAYAYANEALFSKSTDSLVKQRVLGDISRADSTIAVDCLERAGKYKTLSKLISFRNPIYLINSDVTPTDTKAFKKYAIDFKIFILHGTGHYPMIESPDEFNNLLGKALNLISSKKK